MKTILSSAAGAARMQTAKISPWKLLLALTLAAGTAWCAGLAPENVNRVSQTAVEHADHFLGAPQHGKDMLGYIHFGASYRRHDYLRSVAFDNGGFALVYRFKWEDDGITDVAFLCGSRGYVESVQIEYSNGVLNRPFVLANLTITVVGNALLEAYQDKMTEDDRKFVQRMIDNADAKSLLEWSIRFQQLAEE